MPQEKLGILKKCGGGGIRTPGPRKGSLVFKTSAFNHSATPPMCIYFLITLLKTLSTSFGLFFAI